MIDNRYQQIANGVKSTRLSLFAAVSSLSGVKR